MSNKLHPDVILPTEFPDFSDAEIKAMRQMTQDLLQGINGFEGVILIDGKPLISRLRPEHLRELLPPDTDG